MTNKVYIAAAAIAISTLISCGGSDKDDYVDQTLINPATENKDTVPPVNVTNNTGVPNTNAANVPGATPVIPGIQTTPVNLAPQNNNVQVSPATTAVSTTAPGMNPPHGQPGHRCDIQVGAPLDSKPAPANAQPTAVSTQPQQVTTTQVPTQKTAPGMNPPHGEPGHRCEIAVGAPLDSKPAAATTTATPATTTPLMITPAKTDSSKN